MFYIVEVCGCEPYISIVPDESEDGSAMAFGSNDEAVDWATKNCAWEWQVVEF